MGNKYAVSINDEFQIVTVFIEQQDGSYRTIECDSIEQAEAVIGDDIELSDCIADFEKEWRA